MAIEAGSTNLVGEGQSIVRPPLFVGDNYTYWKTRMRLFIQATVYEAWMVIVNGSTIPKKKVINKSSRRKVSGMIMTSRWLNSMPRSCTLYFMH